MVFRLVFCGSKILANWEQRKDIIISTLPLPYSYLKANPKCTEESKKAIKTQWGDSSYFRNWFDLVFDNDKFKKIIVYTYYNKGRYQHRVLVTSYLVYSSYYLDTIS